MANKTESGRTLLETIAVLVVMAALMLTSIVGYNVVTHQWKKNQTVKQISELAIRYKLRPVADTGNVAIKQIYPEADRASAIEMKTADTDKGRVTLQVFDEPTSFAIVVQDILPDSCESLLENGEYDVVVAGKDIDAKSATTENAYTKEYIKNLSGHEKERLVSSLCTEKTGLIFGNPCPNIGATYYYKGHCWSCPSNQRQDKGEQCCSESDINECGYCQSKGYCLQDPSSCPTKSVCNTENKLCVECTKNDHCTCQKGKEGYFCSSNHCCPQDFEWNGTRCACPSGSELCGTGCCSTGNCDNGLCCSKNQENIAGTCCNSDRVYTKDGVKRCCQTALKDGVCFDECACAHDGKCLQDGEQVGDCGYCYGASGKVVRNEKTAPACKTCDDERTWKWIVDKAQVGKPVSEGADNCGKCGADGSVESTGDDLPCRRCSNAPQWVLKWIDPKETLTCGAKCCLTKQTCVTNGTTSTCCDNTGVNETACKSNDCCQSGNCSNGHCCQPGFTWDAKLKKCMRSCALELGQTCTSEGGAPNCCQSGNCSNGHCCEAGNEWLDSTKACCLSERVYTSSEGIKKCCSTALTKDKQCSSDEPCEAGNEWLDSTKACCLSERVYTSSEGIKKCCSTALTEDKQCSSDEPKPCKDGDTLGCAVCSGGVFVKPDKSPVCMLCDTTAAIPLWKGHDHIYPTLANDPNEDGCGQCNNPTKAGEGKIVVRNPNPCPGRTDGKTVCDTRIWKCVCPNDTQWNPLTNKCEKFCQDSEGVKYKAGETVGECGLCQADGQIVEKTAPTQSQTACFSKKCNKTTWKWDVSVSGIPMWEKVKDVSESDPAYCCYEDVIPYTECTRCSSPLFEGHLSKSDARKIGISSQNVETIPYQCCPTERIQQYRQFEKPTGALKYQCCPQGYYALPEIGAECCPKARYDASLKKCHPVCKSNQKEVDFECCATFKVYKDTDGKEKCCSGVGSRVKTDKNGVQTCDKFGRD